MPGSGEAGHGVRLRFLGGAGTVTGSKALLEYRGRRCLIDCGLFQGLKQLRLRNWEPFPIAPASIGAVVLTHAHLDHSGYLPRLVSGGFAGPVLCTPPTRDLCRLLLPDSGRLLEEEADYANRHGVSKHHPALPLYTEADAGRALERFRDVAFEEAFKPMPGVRMRMHRAGHLLGAASVHVEWEGGSLLFSGDVGRSNDLLMPAPAPPEGADCVVVESTYGDRVHPDVDPLLAVAEIVNRTAARGGVVVVPSFAVGRAQALLHILDLLKKAGRIPDLPIFLNSPMAAEATSIHDRHRGEHRLSAEECEALSGVARIVASADESRRLNTLRMPAVIVSASGMATGGRVLHHLKAFAPDHRNTLLFVGFQAAGTRGATIVGGAPTVKIFGEQVPIRAEVANVDALSAHADREELLAWLGGLAKAPKRVVVNHGEPVAADALRHAIEERFGWPCAVAAHDEELEL